MQENKRVYRVERTPGKWLSYLLLFLSAVIIFSGIANRESRHMAIETVATQTPIPLEEGFDETVESREWTLPGATWYALQLGAFETDSAALSLAEQYSPRGAAGYVWPGERYRTLAAVYPSREDAQSVREQLRERYSIETYLYEIPLTPVTVRTQGMKGQIDILQAGFSHAQELIAALQQCSVEMDRQEIGIDDAISALSAMRAQTDLVALRLKQRFQVNGNATVAGLVSVFEDYAAFCDGLSQDVSAAAFGQQLKKQTIQTLYLTKEIYDAL